MKAFCNTCQEMKPASFRGFIRTDCPDEYEDLCCDDCHTIIATIEDRVTDTHPPIQKAESVEPVAWEYQCYRSGFIGGPRWFDELSPTPPPDDPDEIEFRNARPLYTHPAPAVPEGWQLVPKEPTDEMMLAASDVTRSEWSDPKAHFVSHYKAMLAAAPEVK